MVIKENLFDKVISADRVLLRRIKISDADDMFEYTSNVEVTKFLSWEPHAHIEQTKEYIKHVVAEYDSDIKQFTWAIELKGLSRLIGVVRLFDISYANKRAELSYIMNPAFQGKGYIVEAIKAVLGYSFASMNFNRIQARCTPDNFASERVMQKLNFQFEGKLKEYWYIKGNFKDAVLYAVTVQEYLTINSVHVNDK